MGGACLIAECFAIVRTTAEITRTKPDCVVSPNLFPPGLFLLKDIYNSNLKVLFGLCKICLFSFSFGLIFYRNLCELHLWRWLPVWIQYHWIHLELWSREFTNSVQLSLDRPHYWSLPRYDKKKINALHFDIENWSLLIVFLKFFLWL